VFLNPSSPLYSPLVFAKKKTLEKTQEEWLADYDNLPSFAKSQMKER
jgi:hypothetical protein